MPSVARSPLFSVPEVDADPILQEVLVRAEAGKKIKIRSFDPELGGTWEEAEEKLERMRTDINQYGEYVYGLKPAAHHRVWNKAADDVIYRRVPQNKLLIIAPPASAKSTWNSLIRTTYHLGKHPDESLLFLTSSDPMAKIFHTPVEAALRDNQKHRWVFPDQQCRPDKARGWSSDGLYLRGTPPYQKDPSFRAVGWGATVMGARSNGNLVDDPMNQEDAQSPTEQAKSKRYVNQTVIPRLKVGQGWMIGTMTRWAEADLASHFIDLATEGGDWLYLHCPMLATNEPTRDFMGRETGDLLWPEVMTEAYVEGERKRLTIAEFNLIHQGDATGMGGDIFTDEKMFKPLPDNFWQEILPKCYILQAWDMAFSEKKTACYSVGITVAIDSMQNMYILHVTRKKYTISQMEDYMVDIIRTTKPLVSAIETDKFHQEAIRVLARNIMTRVMCNIALITPKDDKVARARLPAARCEKGSVYINRDNKWHRPFIGECLGFPHGRYKDQVDAFSLVTHIAQLYSEKQDTGRARQVETAMR